jgi:hypothetical protein
VKNSHKPNPQRATSKPRRPLQKKGKWGMKNNREGAKTKKNNNNKRGEGEERRHKD